MAEYSTILAAVVIGIVVLFWWLRKNPRYTGGGKVPKGQDDSWTYTFDIQKRPLFQDISTKRIYLLKNYRVITTQPHLKVRARLETNTDIQTGFEPEILEMFFEEGINDPKPANPIAAAVFNEPGLWLFSQVGPVASGSASEQLTIEKLVREKADLEMQLRREKSERKIEVKDTIGMIGRYLRPTVQQQPPKQQVV